jgi:hypothetical protein
LRTRAHLETSLRLLCPWGITALYGGLGLLLTSVAHWPGTHQPMPHAVAIASASLALLLLLLGTLSFAFTERALQGHWTLDACIPGLNALGVEVLLTRRLGLPSATWRLGVEAVMLALIIVQFHVSPWLGAGLVLLALGHVARATVAIAQLELSDRPSPLVTTASSAP